MSKNNVNNIKKLIKIANRMEDEGWGSAYVSIIDDMIKKEAEDSDDSSTILGESVGPLHKGRQETHYPSSDAKSLSSRYCPEHDGVMTARIGDASYQCPIDNTVYNFEQGYKDSEGTVHPGGSVAAQTPDSTNYGVPLRIFENRS